LDVNTVSVVITGVSGLVTACIPLAARFAANRSEAVKAASMSRAEDLALLKDLLQKCIEEKAELRKLTYPLKNEPPKEPNQAVRR
jgi:hypothetical protein